MTLEVTMERDQVLPGSSLRARSCTPRFPIENRVS